MRTCTSPPPPQLLFTCQEMWQKSVHATSDATYCHHKYHLLGCDTMKYSRSLPLFRRNILQTKQAASKVCALLPAWLTLWSWRWRQYVPLKHWQTSIILHGVTSQKIGLCIVITMRTSIWHTCCYLFNIPKNYTTVPQSMYGRFACNQKVFLQICSRYETGK
jgi:hypothetical protein